MTPSMRSDYDKLFNATAGDLDDIVDLNTAANSPEKIPLNREDLTKVNEEINDQQKVDRLSGINFIEKKKFLLNRQLVSQFDRVGEVKANNVHERTCWERFTKSIPPKFDLYTKNPGVPFVLVKDPYETYPSIATSFFCDLDRDMVILYICYFFLIDHLTENPMLSIALTYIIERFIRALRAALGEKNIIKKTL